MIGALLRRLHGVPLRRVPARALRRLRREAADAAGRLRDRRRGTYPPEAPRGPLARCVAAVDPALLRPWAAEIAALSALYREHRFDLLGSGWVRVAHGMECAGLEGHRYPPGRPVAVDPAGAWLAGRINPANLAHARRVWALVDEGYTPVDWHLDFRSGHRWDEAAWYRDVEFGRLPGVDVKVPWELARMQHLPVLAWAYALARDGAAGLAPADAYAREFRNQVLDFIATNPPRFGVNWAIAMDPAIRVANWLVAYDLFRAHGAVFDAPFEAELARGVYAHTAFVAANLEWSPEVRGNHYLADVAGLLFAAAYLPRTRRTDAWLAFAAQEMAGEVEHQFTPDGANFEASTSYHRLSAEMVAYATALLLGLPPEKRAALAEYDARALRTTPPLRPGPAAFAASGGGEPRVPAAYAERVRRMAEFTAHATRPDGAVVQVGDNDSGRFLKLRPVHRRLTVAEARRRYANLADFRALPDDGAYWDEDSLDHGHLGASIGGLFAPAGEGSGAPEPLETVLVRGLARGRTLPGGPLDGPAAAERARVGTDADWTRVHAELHADGALRRVKRSFVLSAGGPPALAAYPGFGLYLFRTPGLYLAVRCGHVGLGGLGAHAHNDQLAMELVVDGTDHARDPGTYLYTPLPGRRNEYRSVRAHDAPRVDGAEPGRLDLGPFRLDAAGGECLYFGPRGFIGLHRGYGAPVYRVVQVDENALHVTDFGHNLSDAPAPPPAFSPGYGRRHA